MAQVYVRWYGNLVQGELLDGECLGMKQVRIPLDGHHPIALFTPGHVYDSPEQVTENSSINPRKSAEISEKAPIIAKNGPVVSPKPEMFSPKDVLTADDREMIEAFKRDNWDHEHNHLRIDKLDEFYNLWRIAMTPSGFVEAEASVTLPSHKGEQCQNCKYWVYTKTLASLHKPVWHCRDGFSPSKDCKHEAEYNDRCMEENPNQRPKDWKSTHHPIVSDEKMEELKQQLKEKLDKLPEPHPAPKPASKKPSKKMLRSTGQQQFNDSTQLSLFD